MGAPTTISNSNNPGPIQRWQGAITFAAVGTDTYTLPVGSSASVAVGTSYVGPILNLTTTVLQLAVGFIPKRIKFINVTTRIQSEWYEGMAALSTLDTDVNGSMSLNAAGPFTVAVNVGTQGSVSQAGGTAPTATNGIIVLTLSGFVTTTGTIVFMIDG